MLALMFLYTTNYTRLFCTIMFCNTYCLFLKLYSIICVCVRVCVHACLCVCVSSIFVIAYSVMGLSINKIIGYLFSDATLHRRKQQEVMNEDELLDLYMSKV